MNQYHRSVLTIAGTDLADVQKKTNEVFSGTVLEVEALSHAVHPDGTVSLMMSVREPASVPPGTRKFLQ